MILVTNFGWTSDKDFMVNTISQPYNHIHLTNKNFNPDHIHDYTGLRKGYLFLDIRDYTISELARIRTSDVEELLENKIFTVSKAQEVIDFVEQNGGLAVDLVINCDAGMSRSAGTAIGILHYYDIDYHDWLEQKLLVSNTAGDFQFANDLVIKCFKDLKRNIHDYSEAESKSV